MLKAFKPFIGILVGTVLLSAAMPHVGVFLFPAVVAGVSIVAYYDHQSDVEHARWCAERGL